MRSWILAFVLFGLMLGILACGTIMRGGSGAVSYVDPGPHFDHAGHLARGVDCVDCHGEEKEGWRKMPDLSACTECHEDIDGEKPPEKRAAAFFSTDGKTGAWTPSTPIGEEIIFDHAHHVRASGGPKNCATCHAEVIASKGVATSTYLTMDECIACHAQAAPTKNDCEDCHREIRTDRAPKSHNVGWKRAHGRMASMGDLDPLPKDCALCHNRSDCDTCHRAEAPQDHTNLFRLSGHGIAAAIDRDRCQVCHTTDSCFLCHQQMKPRNHRGTWGSPFDRHCYSCHLPLEGTDDQGCYVCHKSAPAHAQAPMRPANAPHMTTDSNQCRACHTPAPHPDNGQSCLLCHR
jgi:hypothetical protein